LEASVNSTALFGISPQLTYYHRNIFHGGEVLSLGVKGNFQFRPKSDAYSTEVSATGSILFPKFIGLPTKIFKGKYIPKTEVSLAYNYQDRPEFKRQAIAGEFSYTGRFNSRFSYKFTPIRVNVTRLFGASDDFLEKLFNNIVLSGAYMDKFDMGISTMLYYTTDNSVVPTRPFHYARLNFDLSGNTLSLFNNILPQNEFDERTIWTIPYAQYVRADLHLGKTFRFGKEDKHALALHFNAGAAFPYGNSATSTVPLEKLFYAGGAYSMRGWQARTLGPGTSTLYSEFFTIPSSVGEMKLEANVEYRFPIFWKIEGALFADAGNIWDLPKPGITSDEDQTEGTFGFNKQTLEGIGLDWGLGIRLNFGLILVRLDGGFRIHDPGREEGYRWLGPKEWFDGAYAIHFGVGYPF
jgi:outer membrane protein assembly factor BamA